MNPPSKARITENDIKNLTGFRNLSGLNIILNFLKNKTEKHNIIIELIRKSPREGKNEDIAK